MLSLLLQATQWLVGLGLGLWLSFSDFFIVLVIEFSLGRFDFWLDRILFVFQSFIRKSKSFGARSPLVDLDGKGVTSSSKCDISEGIGAERIDALPR